MAGKRVEVIDYEWTTTVDHGVGSAGFMRQCYGTDPENLIEYAGRVCYRSVRRAGRAPGFIPARIREGHLDVLEHAVLSAKIAMAAAAVEFFRDVPHLAMSKIVGAQDEWLITANFRVWRDVLSYLANGGLVDNAFLNGVAGVAPLIFGEYAAGVDEVSPFSKPRIPAGGMTMVTGQAVVKLLATNDCPPFGIAADNMEEHKFFTFYLGDVSRALTHQLVRHRLGSYSQESQRYVDTSGAVPIVPPALDGDALLAFKDAFEDAMGAYGELRSMGVRKEDARFVLPNATPTRIVVTMNMKSWRHFFALRALDSAAQWEIRNVGQAILMIVNRIAPSLVIDEMRALRAMR